jgi:uncharacterized protein YqjF (DUF2071 family)
LRIGRFPREIAPLLARRPGGGYFQGSAWLGVVPFWLDRIKVRGLPPIAGHAQLSRPERAHLCARRAHGNAGDVFLLAGRHNLLAVALAHTFFHLPYHWAEMRLDQRSEREFSFYSRGDSPPSRSSSRRATGDWGRPQAGRGAQRGRWSIF